MILSFAPPRLRIEGANSFAYIVVEVPITAYFSKFYDRI